jgi:hypothetical protein
MVNYALYTVIPRKSIQVAHFGCHLDSFIFPQTRHSKATFNNHAYFGPDQIARLCQPHGTTAGIGGAILCGNEGAVGNSYLHDPNELVSKFTLALANAILFFQGDAFKILLSPKLDLNDNGSKSSGVYPTCHSLRYWHPLQSQLESDTYARNSSANACSRVPQGSFCQAQHCESVSDHAASSCS